jgi:hypothetical protein
MTSQPTLWTIEKPKKSLRERFTTFHNGNPHVYREIVDIARQMKGRGAKKMGIALIFERLRWIHFIQTLGDEDFKLNNNYKAEYARLIMTREPDLEGFFETRALRRQG